MHDFMDSNTTTKPCLFHPPFGGYNDLIGVYTTSKWLKGVPFVHFSPSPKVIVSIMTK
jgi:hypothetical protein